MGGGGGVQPIESPEKGQNIVFLAQYFGKSQITGRFKLVQKSTILLFL